MAFHLWTPKDYMDNAWHYNPVQGGNLYNQASRIIDFEIKDFSVYIKAQPRDLAKREYTPSYMENVYTVYSDRVQVDNRFVDYSDCTKAVSREQELHAFYTYVAPLSRLKMISFEPLEYSYLICCGNIDEIRETFTENKDFSSNPDLSSTVFSYSGAHK